MVRLEGAFLFSCVFSNLSGFVDTMPNCRYELTPKQFLFGKRVGDLENVFLFLLSSRLPQLSPLTSHLSAVSLSVSISLHDN